MVFPINSEVISVVSDGIRPLPGGGYPCSNVKSLAKSLSPHKKYPNFGVEYLEIGSNDLDPNGNLRSTIVALPNKEV